MTDPFTADQELQDYMAAQAKEYGTYVATADIYVGIALAYRSGDPVPVSNVERHGYEKDGLVTKVATSKAKGA